MLLHPKFSTYLPPGGHLEPNETPEETARREIEEEMGVNQINFIKNGSSLKVKDERTKTLLLPHFLLSEEIETDHYHLDWIFYAEITEKDYISPEGHETRWFTLEDLKKENKIFHNVRELAIYGLENKFYSP